MTKTIYVSESKITTAEEFTQTTGVSTSDPVPVVNVIAAVHMGINEHGKRVVTWELEDEFNFNDSQLQSMQNAIVVLNDRFTKELVEEAKQEESL